VSVTLALQLSAAGVTCTIGSGFLSWMLVQEYHIGIRLTTAQEREEFAVQTHHVMWLHHDHAA
jgi:hypothetical protein